MWRTIFRSSSLWAGVVGAIGAGLTAAGVMTQETWNVLLTVIGVYIPVRVAGDLAKTKIAPPIDAPTDLAYKPSSASEHK